MCNVLNVWHQSASLSMCCGTDVFIEVFLSSYRNVLNVLNMWLFDSVFVAVVIYTVYRYSLYLLRYMCDQLFKQIGSVCCSLPCRCLSVEGFARAFSRDLCMASWPLHVCIASHNVRQSYFCIHQGPSWCSDSLPAFVFECMLSSLRWNDEMERREGWKIWKTNRSKI